MKQEAQLLFHSWNTWLGSQLGRPGGCVCVFGVLSLLEIQPGAPQFYFIYFFNYNLYLIFISFIFILYFYYLFIYLLFIFIIILFILFIFFSAPSITPALPGEFPLEGTIFGALFPCFCLFGEINPSCGLPALSHSAGHPNSLSAFPPGFPDTFQSQ